MISKLKNEDKISHKIANPGKWDGDQKRFHNWWSMVKVWASCVKWTNNNKIREHYQIQVLIHELYKELLAYKQNG